MRATYIGAGALLALAFVIGGCGHSDPTFDDMQDWAGDFVASPQVKDLDKYEGVDPKKIDPEQCTAMRDDLEDIATDAPMPPYGRDIFAAAVNEYVNSVDKFCKGDLAGAIDEQQKGKNSLEEFVRISDEKFPGIKERWDKEDFKGGGSEPSQVFPF